jgi:hypothetical protein
MSKFYNYKKEPIYVDKRAGDFRVSQANTTMHVESIGFYKGLENTLKWWQS